MNKVDRLYWDSMQKWTSKLKPGDLVWIDPEKKRPQAVAGIDRDDLIVFNVSNILVETEVGWINADWFFRGYVIDEFGSEPTLL